jgi:hypothetical protein
MQKHFRCEFEDLLGYAFVLAIAARRASIKHSFVRFCVPRTAKAKVYLERLRASKGASKTEVVAQKAKVAARRFYHHQRGAVFDI